jgi:hypothetical protein
VTKANQALLRSFSRSLRNWNRSQRIDSYLETAKHAEWNARYVTRQVDPPVKVDGWIPAGESR